MFITVNKVIVHKTLKVRKQNIFLATFIQQLLSKFFKSKKKITAKITLLSVR